MFKKADDVTKDILKDYTSDIEEVGMKTIINRKFEPITESPTFIEDMYGYFADSFNGWRILTLQDKSFEVEEGVHLSHFVLTKQHVILAVAYDQKDNEVYFRL